MRPAGLRRVDEPAEAGARGRADRVLNALVSALLFPVLATLLAFAVGAVIILVTGGDPLAAFAALLRGGFGSARALGTTLLNATPLVFTGLAVALAFRAGLFNIGGEGQLYAGAIVSAWLGVALALPGPLVIVICLAGSALAGFVWGAIPGLLKTLGAHEVITTIMLNFIAINFVVYLALNPLSEGGLVPGTAAIEAGRRLPTLGFGLGRAHIGLLIAVASALVAYLLLWRTTRGFELRACGLSPTAASYAGMSVSANSILAIAIAGAFAGLGGGIEVLGPYGKVPVPFVSQLGFNGIGVALLGRNHPAGVVIGALFFGGLAAGSQEMQFTADVPLDLADVLLAVILLFVTATRLIELIVGRRARAIGAGTRMEKGLA